MRKYIVFFIVIFTTIPSVMAQTIEVEGHVRDSERNLSLLFYCAGGMSLSRRSRRADMPPLRFSLRASG